MLMTFFVCFFFFWGGVVLFVCLFVCFSCLLIRVYSQSPAGSTFYCHSKDKVRQVRWKDGFTPGYHEDQRSPVRN